MTAESWIIRLFGVHAIREDLKERSADEIWRRRKAKARRAAA